MNISAFLRRVSKLLKSLFFWLPTKKDEQEQRPEKLHDHALVLAVVSPKHIPRLRQFRYLTRVMTPLESRIFLFSTFVMTAALIFAAYIFIDTRLVRMPVVGGTYTEALIGQPKFLNPIDSIANDIDRDLVRLIFSGLFKTQGMDVLPDLAESYEWSSDFKTLIVKIRKDARFHNNQPLTADDVLFTFDSIRDPERKSPLLSIFRNIKVSLIDNYTVEFILTQPDATFLHKLTIGILPSALWLDIPATNARLSDLNLKAIGSGPYRVKSFSRNNVGNIHTFTLERFSGFYGDKPYITNLVFQFFSSRQESLDAYKGGLIDGVAFVSGSEAQKINPTGRKQDLHLELPQETVAFFNIKDKTLADKNVRQALSLAVYREDIINALAGSANIVTGPYPFGPVTSTEPNIEHARKLLADAGWQIPQNGNVRIWSPKKVTPPVVTTRATGSNSKSSPPASTTTTTTSTPPLASASSTELILTILVPDEPDLLAVAEIIKRQWSVIGARVEIESLPTEELTHRATRDRNCQIVLLNILLNAEQDLLPFWESRQIMERGLNISNIADRGIDEALDKIQKTTSTQALEIARLEAAQTIEKIFPAVFLVRPNQHYLLSDNVKIPFKSMIISAPADRFGKINEWYISTGWRFK